MVIGSLPLKGCADEEIGIGFRNVYGPAAYCCPSVFGWISEIRRWNEGLRNKRRSGRPYWHETDAVIRPILQEPPSASLKTIVETLSISSETIRTHMSRTGYALRTLRWIPHALTCEPKQVRLTMFLQLLPKFRVHVHDNWWHLVTGDENWFYYEHRGSKKS
jgi:hypothetical protein